MATKTKARNNAPAKPARRGPKPTLQVGNVVASSKGHLEGVDPFSPLVIKAIGKDGRLDLEFVGGKRRWTGVRQSSVTKVADAVG